MARPAEYRERTRRTLYMERSLDERIRALARKAGKTYSGYVVDLLEAAVPSQEPSPGEGIPQGLAEAMEAAWELARRPNLKAAWKVIEPFADLEGTSPELDRLLRLVRPPVVQMLDFVDVDRSREYAWIREHSGEHAGEYDGKFVALLGHEVLAASEDYGELRDMLEELRPAHPPLVWRVGPVTGLRWARAPR